MAWEFTNDRPIFQQLSEAITADIIRGKYKPGDKLEAVRDLALTAGVNPNTMQRALSDIEATGLIYTKRGDGRYVSEDKELMELTVQQYVNRHVLALIGTLRAVGLSEEKILQAVKAGLSS